MSGAGLRAARAYAYENPRPDVQALVPRECARILDLGCSSGALGAALRERPSRPEVVGVEADAGYGADAAARLDRVVVADLAALAARDDLRHELGSFDCLVAADVLEHLVDPWTVLAAFASLVEPGGAVVVSLPNVRYWETFWVLARHGTWPRRHEGIFDATHLRWFTLADAWALLEGAGLSVEAVSRQWRLRPVSSPLDRHLSRLQRIPIARALLTFQHVIRARR